MATVKLTILACLAFYSFISIQSAYGYYKPSASRNCMRRLPFIIKSEPALAYNMCPLIRLSKSLTPISSLRTTRSSRRRRSLLLPKLPLLPILPPIIPKIPLLPLPLLPPPLLAMPLINEELRRPLKVPILGKRSVLSKPIHTKSKPIKVPDLNVKAGKRRILDNLLKLKRKGLLSTKEFLKFRKVLLK